MIKSKPRTSPPSSTPTFVSSIFHLYSWSSPLYLWVVKSRQGCFLWSDSLSCFFVVRLSRQFGKCGPLYRVGPEVITDDRKWTEIFYPPPLSFFNLFGCMLPPVLLQQCQQ